MVIARMAATDSDPRVIQPLFPRLSGGPGKLPPEKVAAHQRARLQGAMVEAVARHGYAGTTLRELVALAGVSKSTFYEHFENREACLLAGFEDAVDESRRRITGAAEREESWPEQLRAGLTALLDYIVEEPALARTCLVESVTAGPAAAELYESALQSAADALRPGRKYANPDLALPYTLEDSIVGGIVWMVVHRLQRGEAESIPDVLPTMLEFALASYLGESEASKLVAAN